MRLGIAPAIGLMLMNIGLGSNVGVYSETGGPFYVMRDFFGALTPSVAQTTMGSGYSTMVLTVVTMFVGVFVIVILAKNGVKAAVLLGMLVASIIYWVGDFVVLGVNPFASLSTASFVPPFADMVETTLFKFNFQRVFADRMVHLHHPDHHLLHDRHVRYHRHPGGHRLPGRHGG